MTDTELRFKNAEADITRTQNLTKHSVATTTMHQQVQKKFQKAEKDVSQTQPRMETANTTSVSTTEQEKPSNHWLVVLVFVILGIAVWKKLNSATK